MVSVLVMVLPDPFRRCSTRLSGDQIDGRTLAELVALFRHHLSREGQHLHNEAARLRFSSFTLRLLEVIRRQSKRAVKNMLWDEFT